MNFIFKFSSIIYRTILLLLVPFAFIANLFVASAGHNKSFSYIDYLIFALALTTTISLTTYENSSNEYKANKKLFFSFIVCLILTSIVIQLFFQFDTIFICKCFQENGLLANILTLSFLLVSFLVLVGLLLGKKKLQRNLN